MWGGREQTRVDFTPRLAPLTCLVAQFSSVPKTEMKGEVQQWKDLPPLTFPGVWCDAHCAFMLKKRSTEPAMKLRGRSGYAYLRFSVFWERIYSFHQIIEYVRNSSEKVTRPPLTLCFPVSRSGTVSWHLSITMPGQRWSARPWSLSTRSQMTWASPRLLPSPRTSSQPTWCSLKLPTSGKGCLCSCTRLEVAW